MPLPLRAAWIRQVYKMGHQGNFLSHRFCF
jgi:hypothetical protein